jgi:Sphingosine kinase and enzymes related to eukaryotic diacylglycerol kinase
MPRKALLVYNPLAGGAVAPDSWLGEILHKLCSTGDHIVTTLATTPASNSETLLAILEGDNSSFDLLIAAGGDGTIRMVLEAAAKSKAKPTVGIVPVGTGNQLARNLGLSEENFLVDPLNKPIDTLIRGEKFQMDLGMMNDSYFAVAAGAGPMSDAIAAPGQIDKVNWRMLAYASSLVQTIAQAPILFNVTADGEQFKVAASGLFIFNISDLGVGSLSDNSSIDDGLLDLCVLAPKEFQDYLEVGFRFTSGIAADTGPYYIKQVKSLFIEVLPVSRQSSVLEKTWRNLKKGIGLYEKPPLMVHNEVPVTLDGDTEGMTPMRIEVAPKAVTVLVPPGFRKDGG